MVRTHVTPAPTYAFQCDSRCNGRESVSVRIPRAHCVDENIVSNVVWPRPHTETEGETFKIRDRDPRRAFSGDFFMPLDFHFCCCCRSRGLDSVVSRPPSLLPISCHNFEPRSRTSCSESELSLSVTKENRGYGRNLDQMIESLIMSYSLNNAIPGQISLFTLTR